MCGSGSTRRLPVALVLLAFLSAPCPAQVAPAPSAASPTGAGSTAEAEALFRFPVGGVVTAGPALGAGRSWLLSDSKTLYVLTIDGVAIGRRTLSDRRSAFIACDDFGRAAISEGATGIALVNKAGQEVWRVELGAVPASAPVFAADGRMFVVAGGALFAYAPNGSRLWKTALPAGQSSPVIIGPEGGPAIGLADGTVLLFTADGGTPLTAESGIVMDSGIAVVALAGVPGRLAATLEDGRLVVLQPDPTGNSLVPVLKEPAARLGSRPLAAASSQDGFYALGTDGTLLAADPDGRELWRVALRLGSGPATLAAFEGRVVVLTKSTVWSYGHDGSLYRTLRLSNVASLPAIAPTGAVFAGGADWILYAYRFERPLVALALPALPVLDLEAIDLVAKEESFWSIAPYDDSVAMERLNDIEKSMESGTIGTAVRQASLYLAAVALGKLDAPFGIGAVGVGPTPSGTLPRVYACGLLGKLGLPQAVPVLVEAFRSDPEPAVRAAAAAAVAAIGLDPDGEALAAFARAAERRLDVRTAGAIVAAIDVLYRASGALDDKSGILALVRISGGDYPRDLRSMAENALKRVSRPR